MTGEVFYIVKNSWSTKGRFRRVLFDERGVHENENSVYHRGQQKGREKEAIKEAQRLIIKYIACDIVAGGQPRKCLHFSYICAPLKTEIDMLKEFKNFIMTGNVIDFAVAVIMAGALRWSDQRIRIGYRNAICWAFCWRHGLRELKSRLRSGRSSS